MWRLADHADAAATQTASHTISLRCVNAIGHGDGQSAYGELGSDEMALVLAEPEGPGGVCGAADRIKASSAVKRAWRAAESRRRPSVLGNPGLASRGPGHPSRFSGTQQGLAGSGDGADVSPGDLSAGLFFFST